MGHGHCQSRAQKKKECHSFQAQKKSSFSSPQLHGKEAGDKRGKKKNYYPGPEHWASLALGQKKKED